MTSFVFELGRGRLHIAPAWPIIYRSTLCHGGDISPPASAPPNVRYRNLICSIDPDIRSLFRDSVEPQTTRCRLMSSSRRSLMLLSCPGAGNGLYFSLLTKHGAHNNLFSPHPPMPYSTSLLYLSFQHLQICRGQRVYWYHTPIC